MIGVQISPSLRIAFLLNNLNGGGAERVAVTVANTLAEKGHEVSLVLNRRQGPYLADVSEEVKVVVLGQRMLYVLPLLLKLLRREQFDAVLTILDQPSIAALLLKPFIGKTRIIVVECNNPLPVEGGPRKPVWRLVRSLRRWLYPRSDHIISKSEGIKHALITHFGCRTGQVTAIANPVDIARIDMLAAEPPDHHWLTNRETSVILAVGRLEPQKDYATLLYAFALLRQSRPARLIILGEGGERFALEALAQRLGVAGDVDMPGFARNPYALMRDSDLYVLSSRWEGWPNALVEALACGTPVVATDCDSGPRDILRDGEFGTLVPVGDVDALARAMHAALDAPRDTDELKRRAGAFTPEKAALAYEDVIRKVMNR